MWGCVVKRRPEASAGTKAVCVATDHRALTTLYRSEADVKMKVEFEDCEELSELWKNS